MSKYDFSMFDERTYVQLLSELDTLCAQLVHLVEIRANKELILEHTDYVNAFIRYIVHDEQKKEKEEELNIYSLLSQYPTLQQCPCIGSRCPKEHHDILRYEFTC